MGSTTTMADPAAAQPWVVNLTPFDDEGALDEAALRLHLQRMARAGIGVYVASSNAGEGLTLTAQERDRLFGIAVQELRGKVPVRAGGCEPQSVAAAHEYLRAASAAGLDAAHLFPLDTGHAGPLKPQEIEAYYREALECAGLPVVISNYPAMGSVLSLDLVRQLLDRFPHLIAIRDAGGDTNYLRELVAICRGRANVYTGGVRTLASAMFHGSQGCLSAEANLAPGTAVAAVTAFLEGNMARARAAHEQLYRIHLLVNRFGGSAGRGMKPLLSKLGLPAGTLRAPRMALVPHEIDAMLAEYSAISLDFENPA